MRVREYGLEWELDSDPKKGQLGLLHENHYRRLFESPKTNFNVEDVWLDIGANFGAFAVRAASYVKEVVAVDPVRELLFQLKVNADLNEIGNIRLVPSAVVGGAPGIVPLALSNSFSSTHRVGHIRGRKSIDVPSMNINDIVEMYGASRIKMDAEGSEAEILEKMDLEPIDEIIFEYHFSMLKDTKWTQFYGILHRFREAGFQELKVPAERTKTWNTIVWVKRP